MPSHRLSEKHGFGVFTIRQPWHTGPWATIQCEDILEASQTYPQRRGYLDLVDHSTPIVTCHISHFDSHSCMLSAIHLPSFLTSDKVTRHIFSVHAFSNFPCQKPQRSTVDTWTTTTTRRTEQPNEPAETCLPTLTGPRPIWITFKCCQQNSNSKILDSIRKHHTRSEHWMQP